MKIPLPARMKPAVPTGLATRSLHRNLAYADGSVWAWYRIGPLPWSLRSLEERERSHANQMSAWAGLVGRSVHLRMTNVLFPRDAWARQLHARTSRFLDTDPGGMTSAQWLAAQQERILSARLSQPFRAVGVKIPGVSWSTWENYTGQQRDPENPLAREVQVLDRLMAVPGFTPRPNPALSAAELWWLMHRSVALGIDPPSSGAGFADHWAPGHMAEFTDPVTTDYRAGDRAVRVTTLRDGAEQSRHVTVLNLIQLGERHTAEHQQPWLASLDRFPFGVEVSAHLDILDGRELVGTMERLQQRAVNIGRHVRESRRLEALSVQETVEHARQARHEVEKAAPEEACRVYGVIRIAVSGETETQVQDRAHKVTEYLAREQRIRAVHRSGQWALYREFIPGEPVRLSAIDVERMPNAFWATSWPGASSSVGDGIGVYTARTTGVSRRAVMVEPHYPTIKHEQSSLTGVTGNLGSGKSYLGGGLAGCAAYRDHLVGLNDPDGRLARLADMPELRRHTRLIQLTKGNAQPGLLNPWRVLPDPLRPPGEPTPQYMAAFRDAQVQRRQLAASTMLQFLPPVLARTKGIRATVLAAMTQVGSEYGTSPWAFLRALTEADTELGKELRQSIESQAGLLVFGEDRQTEVDYGQDDGDSINFTIITSPGLPFPDPRKDPIDWSIEEALSVPIRVLANFLLTAIARHPDRDLLKDLFFDEVGIGAQSPAYVNHVQQLARTNRGNTTAMYLMSQDAADIDRLGIRNWATRWWLGRAASVEDASIALGLAGLPTTAGYEADVLPNLSRVRPGQFVYVDEVKQAEVVEVDFRWWPSLHAALDRPRPKIEDQEWLAGAAA